LGIENRKLKIEKKFSLSKPATTTQKNNFKTKKIKKYFLIFFFASAQTPIRADTPQRPRGRGFYRVGGR
jgi:hypothetical protein